MWNRGTASPNQRCVQIFSKHLYSYDILENTLFKISTGSLVLKLLCTGGHFLYWSCPLHVCYSNSMDQPGKVANPARGQLIRENEYFPVPVRAWEFGLARRVRQSRPASACSSPYSGWIWCLRTYVFLPRSAAASIGLSKTAIRHRVSREFIESRNYVPMAFTAESPPA